MRKFAIFGAGGHAKVIADILDSNGDCVEYLIDDEPKGKVICGIKAILREEFLSIPQIQNQVALVLAIGNNALRKQLYEFFKSKGFDLPTIIHRSAIISKSSFLQEACVVMPQVVLNAKSQIGVGVILNTACVVEHDCKIGDFSHIAPRSVLCGGASVGKVSHIGANSVIIEGKSVGDFCLVGAGSVVIHNIVSNKKVVGNPAKKELK
ncbi:MAG: acetyltransferase [Helicobacter sp.]|nr:acetyltransferase [Helicobacter sp.]